MTPCFLVCLLGLMNVFQFIFSISYKLQVLSTSFHIFVCQVCGIGTHPFQNTKRLHDLCAASGYLVNERTSTDWYNNLNRIILMHCIIENTTGQIVFNPYILFNNTYRNLQLYLFIASNQWVDDSNSYLLHLAT